jgi:glucan endo-1,3-alpha-glucosidase
MANILNMSPRPDFILAQILKDGPESHNIGNLWPEQNTDMEPSYYMENHTTRQPLLSSFIAAWDNRGDDTSMTPTTGGTAAGTMWYRSLPTNAGCANDDGQFGSTRAELFWEKPDGFDSALEAVNWAIVLPQGMSTDVSLQVYSGEELMGTFQTLDGLNYGNRLERNPDPRQIMLINTVGTVLMTATEGECVYDAQKCFRGIYNMNYEVVPFVEGYSIATCSGYSPAIGS